jgi:SNF2 family DNA or RNA helicase
MYSSPTGLYEFQADGVSVAYLNRNVLAAFDTGLGKTHVAMALAAMLFEDDEIDLCLVVAEKNKIREWHQDFRDFTRMDSVIYHGPDRVKRVSSGGTGGPGRPRVIISTYETIRNDCATFLGPRKVRSGPFMEHLDGQRVLVVYDELTKLATRRSALYKAHEFMLKELRRADPGRVLGLTANPLTTGWESTFNMLRLVDPERMPPVGVFNDTYVRSRDDYRRPYYNDKAIPHFVALCRPLIIRKRKTDPDVIEQFPKKVEEVEVIEMAEDQRKIYKLIEGFAWDDNGDYVDIPGLWTVLRQFAGHPAALVAAAENGGSELALQLVQGLGVLTLKKTSSAKTQALIALLRKVSDQGDKALVFSFFGQTVLPVLAEELRREHFKVFVHHGGMTEREQFEIRQEFRAYAGPAVLLSSDAGARGINLPEATYVIEYESALSYFLRDQRFGRSHRIDSRAPSITCTTMVLEGTLERGILDMALSRNAQQDQLLGDVGAEGFLTAVDRRRMLSIARARKKNRDT